LSLLVSLLGVQVVLHTTVGLLYILVGALGVSLVRGPQLVRLLLLVTAISAGLYRLGTAYYVFMAQKEPGMDAGFSSTVLSLILNANILAFGLGAMLVLIVQRVSGRDGPS
jgi:hypothetical protein